MKLTINNAALHKMKDGTWIPPIKAYVSGPVNTTGDLECEFDILMQHHEKETKMLLAVIQELATKLVDTNK